MSVPSVETKIFEAIAARVRTLPMLTGSNAYDLVWTAGDDLLQTEAGADYKPSPSKRYIRATWTPNQVSREGRVDGSLPHRRPGILQLDVYGLKTQPTGAVREVAGQVAGHFPTDLCMTFMGVKVRVMQAPSVYGPFVDTHIQVPVEILLEAYA